MDCDSVTQDGNVIGLQPLVGFHNIKANQLSLAENTAAATTDSTEVNENLIATVTHDKAKAFLDIKPLDGAFFITLRAVLVVAVVFVLIVVLA